MRGLISAASALLLVVSSLVGCTIIDGAVSERVLSLNASIDQASNDAVLLNVVRASRAQPLTFVAISRVGGSQQTGMNNGLPSFTFGPDLSISQKQYTFGNNSVNNQAAGSFDVSHLSSRDFMRGMLVPLTLQEVDFLLKQGVPREVLFNLVVDSIGYTLEEKGAPTRRLNRINDPRDPSAYLVFNRIAYELIQRGLYIESRREENPFYDSNDKSGASPRIAQASRVCFEGTLNVANHPFHRNTKLRELMCGSGWHRRPIDLGKKRTVVTQAEPLSIELDLDIEGDRHVVLSDIVVNLRSIYSMFVYVGRRMEHQPRLSTHIPPNSVYARKWPVIEKGARAGCFSSISFEGEGYCVPSDASEETRQVFAVLTQLIALKTQPGDVPFVPTVRVTP